MSDETTPERPPTSGPGSGAAKWRAYAAAVTGSPGESWAQLDRDEVIALLRKEGVLADEETPPIVLVREQGTETVVLPEGTDNERAPRRGRPTWMVPTDKGLVPEHAHDRRRGRR